MVKLVGGKILMFFLSALAAPLIFNYRLLQEGTWKKWGRVGLKVSPLTLEKRGIHCTLKVSGKRSIVWWVNFWSSWMTVGGGIRHSVAQRGHEESLIMDTGYGWESNLACLGLGHNKHTYKGLRRWEDFGPSVSGHNPCFNISLIYFEMDQNRKFWSSKLKEKVNLKVSLWIIYLFSYLWKMFLYHGRDWETDNDLNNPNSLRPCVREESRLADWKVEVELHRNYSFSMRSIV